MQKTWILSWIPDVAILETGCNQHYDYVKFISLFAHMCVCAMEFCYVIALPSIDTYLVYHAWCPG